MLETWTAQLQHIEKVANFWCDFAIVCGVIGFVLAVACAVCWILLIKKTQRNDSNALDALESEGGDG